MNKKVYVSGDVKFNEFISWYKPGPIKIEEEVNQPYIVKMKKKMRKEKDSILDLLGPSEGSSLVNPWSRNLSEAQKRVEIKNGKKPIVDHSNDKSMDEEFDVPIMQTPRVKILQRYIPPHARRHEKDVHET